MWGIKVHTISGMCLGLEFLWGFKVMALDLLVVRIYVGKVKNNV